MRRGRGESREGGEASLVMVPLHIEDAGGAPAVAFKGEAPGGMADRRGMIRARRRRLRGDQPARGGCARPRMAGLAHEQAHDAVLGGAATPAGGFR